MRAHFGVLWLFGGATSPCSIGWFDKLAPVGIPIWYLSSGTNGRKAPSIYRNKAVLARRRTASATKFRALDVVALRAAVTYGTGNNEILRLDLPGTVRTF